MLEYFSPSLKICPSSIAFLTVKTPEHLTHLSPACTLLILATISGVKSRPGFTFAIWASFWLAPVIQYSELLISSSITIRFMPFKLNGPAKPQGAPVILSTSPSFARNKFLTPAAFFSLRSFISLSPLTMAAIKPDSVSYMSVFAKQVLSTLRYSPTSSMDFLSGVKSLVIFGCLQDSSGP